MTTPGADARPRRGLLLTTARWVNARLRIVASAEDSDRYTRVDRELDLIDELRARTTPSS